MALTQGRAGQGRVGTACPSSRCSIFYADVKFFGLPNPITNTSLCFKVGRCEAVSFRSGGDYLFALSSTSFLLSDPHTYLAAADQDQTLNGEGAALCRTCLLLRLKLPTPSRDVRSVELGVCAHPKTAFSSRPQHHGRFHLGRLHFHQFPRTRRTPILQR